MSDWNKCQTANWNKFGFSTYGILTDCFFRFCYKDGNKYVADIALSFSREECILIVWLDVSRLMLLLYCVLPLSGGGELANKILKDSGYE